MLLWKECTPQASFANDAWLEKYSRNGNVLGDSDDVTVLEHVDLTVRPISVVVKVSALRVDPHLDTLRKQPAKSQ